jgi:small subunit ribosomal protein S17
LTDERGRRRILTGRVTSDKMEKTVVVAVDVVRRHRVYGRLIHHTQKFKAHDANNRCQIGDVVEMRESRPLSREKRWIISRILRGGKVEIPIVEPAGANPDNAGTPEKSE